MSNSVTLQTAVLNQVREFAANGTTFSIHDITNGIRQKVSTGLEIPEVAVSGRSFSFNIEHVTVKKIFNDLWETGVFDPEFTLTRTDNGTYFEFTATMVNPASTQVQQVSSPVSTPQSTKIDTATATNRIRTYLTNCVFKNTTPTLKNIQSAIKRKSGSSGLTCEEIKDIVEQLKYSIVTSPNFIKVIDNADLSKSVVAVFS